MRIISSIKCLLVIGASVGAIIVSVLPAHASLEKTEGLRVNVAGLNVRTGPDKNYHRVGIIHKNEIYITTGKKKGEWNQIWYDRDKRWIHSGYTKRDYFWFAWVTTPVLNVRTGPNKRYRKVGVALENSLYAYIDCNDLNCSWTKIWYRSEPRWVYSKYLNERNKKALSFALKAEIELSNVDITSSTDRTNSRYITVQYDSTAAPEYYRISESPEFSDANWIKANGSEIDYTLSDKAGNKTLYLQLKNENGRLSNVDSDTIYYLPKLVK